MITQLDPPLPLETPRGAGLAHFVIDYGPEADLVKDREKARTRAIEWLAANRTAAKPAPAEEGQA